MSTYKILIVEDSPTMRQLMIFALKKLPDVELVQASDGVDALRKLPEQDFDLVLTDINMPVMDGLTTTKHIRATDHPNRNVPIIALSANIDAVIRDNCFETGMQGFVAKPFEIKQLTQELERVLQTRYDNNDRDGEQAAANA